MPTKSNNWLIVSALVCTLDTDMIYTLLPIFYPTWGSWSVRDIDRCISGGNQTEISDKEKQLLPILMVDLNYTAIKSVIKDKSSIYSQQILEA